MVSETGRATLHFNNGAVEKAGGPCSRATGLCQSTGSFWTDTGTGSACGGYGTRTLGCTFTVPIQTSFP